MPALYRKWRPQKFSELLGQDHVRKTLQNALSQGRVAHAYLFAGPHGCGKTTTARLLAKSVNCLNFKEEPCDQCSSCLEIKKGSSLDLIEIDAASNRGIDEIRQLREKIKFTPSKSKYKVYVVDEAHQLTKEAFNALLKTLEEPPPWVIFILATTEPHRVPPTILSRCQRFDFRRPNESELIKRLRYIAEKEKIEIDSESEKMLSQAASGSVRDLESLLDTILARGLKKITKKEIEEVLGIAEPERLKQLYHFMVKKDLPSALVVINQVVEQGKDLNQFTTGLVDLLRQKLLENPSLELSSWIKIILKAQREIKNCQFIQLPLELAMVEIIMGPKTENAKSINQTEAKNSFSKNNQSPAANQDLTKPDTSPLPKASSTDPLPIDWQKVISAIRPYNHSLCFLLQGSQPLFIQDNQLVLGVGFKFHKDKLEEAKNRKIIEEAIKKVTGQCLKLSCRLIKTPSQNLKNEGIIKEIAEVFEI